eukprot:TRINITY_DN17450_c0_g1_i1.p1 TRINITY_DN17450_c0_g1~~TRINITY_DN17450_c0_g1_i1.p1  ORF type:complete len:176 (-),score=27.80 TRINITY_DN17450_c0_g1_i1:120-584(-)
MTFSVCAMRSALNLRGRFAVVTAGANLAAVAMARRRFAEVGLSRTVGALQLLRIQPVHNQGLATVFRRGASSDVLRSRLEEFQEQFAETRMCLEDARESADTTYFADDILEAKEAVEKVTALYEALLVDLDDTQRGEVERANDLKVRCLREEQR